MAEIGFYHLTRTTLVQALPQLLGRTIAAGQRAAVVCGTEDGVAALDKALWQAPEPEWLPHGTPADGDPDLQPVWLSTDDSAPNGARFLFLVDGGAATRITGFDRVFDLFDGNRAHEVAAARLRWTAAKAAGHTLAYWQQGPRGWERKA
jgi:DNA polymerase-3 subunit chi